MAQVLSGVSLIEDGDQVLVANRFRKSGFEPQTIALWTMLAKRGKSMIDAGAYTGFYSILAMRNGASGVIAYEPNPKAAQRFRENVIANCASGIDIRERALSDTRERVALHGKPSLTSAGSIVGNAPVIGYVNTCRLDDENVGRVYAMKIDVERAEPQVLRGAAETLREYTPHLLIEALDGVEEIESIIGPMGYTGRKLDVGMYYYRVRSSCA